MSDLFGKKHTHVSLIPVSLGTSTINIPVAKIIGKAAGPTLLITAGNDGDEYAGIAAAYALIEEYANASFSGTLIVIPIVNIPGFEQEMSQNPIDHNFPKYIYPGDKNGSASERLRYWLSEYAESSDFWLDLHGGSLVESLIPFAWGWKSGNADFDMSVLSMIQKLPVAYSAFSNTLDFSKRLASKGCKYLLTESGAGGNNTGTSIDLQITMTRIVMSELHMIHGDYSPIDKQIFSTVTEYILKKDGIWNANFHPGTFIQKGSQIGVTRSLSGDSIEIITAKHDGVLLWGKEGLSARKGDVIAGVGY